VTGRHIAMATTLAVAYAGTVLGANWAIGRYGAVPVGLGLAAPAGVYFAGLAFTLRDLLHEVAGRWMVLVAIAAGAGLSLAVTHPQRIAVASAAAFAALEDVA
jgi:pheromone shutdown protein TraB